MCPGFPAATLTQVRQATFRYPIGEWTCHRTIKLLAMAGFVPVDDGKWVQCVYCLTKIDFGHSVFASQHPMVVHASHNIHCFLVQKRLMDEPEGWHANKLGEEKDKERKQLWNALEEFALAERLIRQHTDGVECG